MNLLELISIALDILLVIAAVLAYLARPRIGGQLSKGLRILLVGIIVLGMAHFVETVLFAVFNVDRGSNEIIHRLIVSVGFVFVVLGFVIMRRAFEE